MGDIPSAAAAVAEYTRLMSLAVHELRTPTSVVGGYLRMLQKDTSAELSERQRRMIDEAEKSCARLAALIGELSDLSKLDAGTAAVKSERFDIFQLVVEVAQEVREGRDRDIELETRGPVSGGHITGDHTRLKTALAVIVRAVMREQPAATRVVVQSRRSIRDGQPVASVTVAPEADLERALESHPVAFDDARGGLGLGLPIARRVFDRHGGQVWSALPDQGVELPVGSRGAIAASLPLSE
jgi:two-component system sensor histidine kinase ArlS